MVLQGFLKRFCSTSRIDAYRGHTGLKDSPGLGFGV